MGSVQRKFRDDRTYEAVETVAGGQLVEARAAISTTTAGAAPAGVAADESVKVLGVAQKDAVAPGDPIRVPAAGVLDLVAAPAEFEVFAQGFIPGVKYSTAAAYGARLVAGPLGTVKPWTDEPPTAIVGWCAQPGGVLLNATGLTYINV